MFLAIRVRKELHTARNGSTFSHAQDGLRLRSGPGDICPPRGSQDTVGRTDDEVHSICAELNQSATEWPRRHPG